MRRVSLPRFVPDLAPPDDLTAAEAMWIAVHASGVFFGDPADVGFAPAASHYVGTFDGRPVWVADIATDAGDELPRGMFTPLMGLYGSVDDVTWHVAGRAVQLVDWQRSHRFCGRCATPTEPSAGERALRCPSCGLKAYPRVAPAAIVLVERNDEILLARNVNFPLPMYSLLAGFVEPGETIEECVTREVREEVGIEVTDVRYAGSQPWPFPHSLMLGFVGTYAGGELVLDPAEIADAGWYRADALPMIPPRMSIARVLIDDWLNRGSSSQ
jgi:NAD+ diphosphatase